MSWIQAIVALCWMTWKLLHRFLDYLILRVLDELGGTLLLQKYLAGEADAVGEL